jgi:hypothetical protein
MIKIINTNINIKIFLKFNKDKLHYYILLITIFQEYTA